MQRSPGALGGEPALAETTVTLAPGAQSSFWIEWSSGSEAAAGTLEITPPNQTTQILLFDPGIPLDVATVSVSALSAGVIPPPSPSTAANVEINGPYADLWWQPQAHPFSVLQVPMEVPQLPVAGGGQVPPAYFWSTEFFPIKGCDCANGDGGYFGLQADKSGERAIFSWWSAIRASSPNPDATITNFTGEGSGVQVLVPFEIVAGRQYQLRLSRTGVGPLATTWEAVIADPTAGSTTVLGAMVVPDAWGESLQGSTTSFMEYYGTPTTDCSQLPDSVAQWGPVTMNGALPTYVPYFHYGAQGPTGCPATQSQVGPGSFQQQLGTG